MPLSMRMEDGLIVGSVTEMMRNPGTYQNYWGSVPAGGHDKDCLEEKKWSGRIGDEVRVIDNTAETQTKENELPKSLVPLVSAAEDFLRVVKHPEPGLLTWIQIVQQRVRKLDEVMTEMKEDK